MSFTLGVHAQEIERNGYTVIEDFLSPAVLAKALADNYLNRVTEQARQAGASLPE